MPLGRHRTYNSGARRYIIKTSIVIQLKWNWTSSTSRDPRAAGFRYTTTYYSENGTTIKILSLISRLARRLKRWNVPFFSTSGSKNTVSQYVNATTRFHFVIDSLTDWRPPGARLQAGVAYNTVGNASERTYKTGTELLNNMTIANRRHGSLFFSIKIRLKCTRPP
jgi:hypothetical protein